jgi:hypothetical protein
VGAVARRAAPGVTGKRWPLAARTVDAPFPVSPSGGKPGREGSPHAAKTRRRPPPRLVGPCTPNGVVVHPIAVEDRELYRRILGVESPWSVTSMPGRRCGDGGARIPVRQYVGFST